MAVLVAVVVIGVVVAGGAWAMRRRDGDEIHSVEGYRHTLDTLQDIRSRSAASVRILRPPSEEDPLADAVPLTGTGTGTGTGRDPRRDRSPVEQRAGTAARRRATVLGDDRADELPLAGGRQDGRQRAISALNRPRRRYAGPVVVGAIVVIVLAVVVAFGVKSHHPPATSGSAAAGGAAGSGGKAGAPAGSGKAKAKANAKGSSTTHAVTTTTLPTAFSPLTSTATSATYGPPSTTYSLTLTTTSGPCWVDVTGASGTTLFTQTMAAGTSKTITASGAVKAVFGAPSSVSVSLDHEAVNFPAGFQAPLTLTFVPATSGSSGSPTATTSTSTGASSTSTGATAGSGAG